MTKRSYKTEKCTFVSKYYRNSYRRQNYFSMILVKKYFLIEAKLANYKIFF